MSDSIFFSLLLAGSKEKATARAVASQKNVCNRMKFLALGGEVIQLLPVCRLVIVGNRPQASKWQVPYVRVSRQGQGGGHELHF